MSNGVRGLVSNDSQTLCFCVVGSSLQRVNSDGTRTTLGALRTRRGFVDMVIGVSQLVLVDGANGYVYDIGTGTFGRITSTGWRGSRRVGYVGGFFLFSDPDTGEWYISAIEDANSLNALDFATASSSPDNIMCAIGDHGSAWLMGEVTGEVWDLSGAADFPFEKNLGATMMTGVMGAFTVRSLDNTLFWLGRDKSGDGMVWRAQGYTPQRVSNRGVEEAIQAAIRGGANMTQASAYGYQQDGLTFYVLHVPGCPTSWALDVASGEWHERAELVKGEFVPSRIRFHAKCFGQNLVAGVDDPRIFALDPSVFNNAGDVLVRDRVSPHYSMPGTRKIKYGPAVLECTVGEGLPDGAEPTVRMRTSDDGAKTWNSWRDGGLGAIGEALQQVTFIQNGAANDRVWNVRCTDDCEFSIFGFDVEGRG